MKRFIFFILTVIIAQFFFCLHLYAQEKITVGIYQNEPIVFKDTEGQVKGIYIDILEHIAKREEWDLNYISGTWPECLNRLEKGEIDILTGIAYSDERSKRFDFNSEAVVSNWAQVYTPLDSEILSFIDLSGKKMAVLKADIYYRVFKMVSEKFKINPVFVEVDNYAMILKLVEEKTVDAGLVPRIFGSYHGKEYQIKKSTINFVPVELHFAAPKGKNKHILNTIDRHLTEMKNSKHSIYHRSLNLWIEGAYKLVFPKWLRPIWVVGFIAGLLIYTLSLVLILRWHLRIRTAALTETIAAKEKIESELKIAREIQMDLLPDIFPPFPDRNEFEIYAVIEPAKQVGGDLYDFFFIDDHHLFFFIGDVSDKGVPAALFMARTKTLIQSAAKGIVSSDKILHRVNKELSMNNDSFMFVTAFCGILNVKTGEVCYANAGHNPPLITNQEKEADFLTVPGGTALGIDGESIYQEANLILHPGNILFMYTDGVTEAFNTEKEQFSENRLQKEVTVHQKDAIEDMVLSILEKVQIFSGEMPQTDDITILALKYSQESKIG